jgi:hypothetical protein
LIRVTPRLPALLQRVENANGRRNAYSSGCGSGAGDRLSTERRQRVG